MQAAFGSNASKHERAWHYLRALDPDIALLQEVNPPEWAKKHWQIHHGAAYEKQKWGSAVAVKEGLYSWDLESSGEPLLPKYEGSSVVLVEVQVGLQRLIACSIHASAWELSDQQVEELQAQGAQLDSFRFGGVQKIWPIYIMFHALEEILSGKSFLVGGDFNAARLMDDFSWMAGGNSEFFDSIETKGFNSTLQKFHEGEVQTYFKRNNNPYQLDHLYCSGDLVDGIKRCDVIEHPVTILDLSDHAPIIAEWEAP